MIHPHVESVNHHSFPPSLFNHPPRLPVDVLLIPPPPPTHHPRHTPLSTTATPPTPLLHRLLQILLLLPPQRPLNFTSLLLELAASNFLPAQPKELVGARELGVRIVF